MNNIWEIKEYIFKNKVQFLEKSAFPQKKAEYIDKVVFFPPIRLLKLLYSKSLLISRLHNSSNKALYGTLNVK